MSMDIATLSIAVKSDSVNEAKSAMDRATDSAGALEGMVGKLAAAFGLYKISDWAKDTILLAARYETLGVAMTVVGHNAGYTEQQMAGFQSGLEKTGISMIESRNNLTRMAAAQLDLAKSSQLARVAQDAAVVAGINSSDAFERLVQGIVTGQPHILHTMGIFANFAQEEKRWAEAHGKTAEDLSNAEKIQIRFNATLFEGEKRAGAYEASMETAGKQIFSMQRYVQDLEVRIGGIFGPALQKLVFDFVDQLKAASTALDNMQKSGQLVSLMNSLRDTIGSIVGPLVTFTKTLWDHRTEIILMAGAYTSIKLGIIIAGWVSALQTWVAAQKVALVAMASFNAATGEMAMASTAATVATKGMTAGMAALGGPIGIVIALLGVAAIAWMNFKDKTSEEAKKAGLNIESETAALQKKIEKQKQYWDLLARGASTAEASKGLRPTADDDPGVKDLDAKYGLLQSKFQKLWDAEEARKPGHWLTKPEGDVQREMNDLLAKRQRFVEIYNQAQHGADLVEESQINSAKKAGVAGAVPEEMKFSEYGREILKLKEQIMGLTVSERDAYEMKLKMMDNGAGGDVSKAMALADQLHALKELDAERKESIKLDAEEQAGINQINAGLSKKKLDDLYKSYEATAYLRVGEEELNKERERTATLLTLETITLNEYTKRMEVLRVEQLRLKAETGNTWAIIGQVVEQSASMATEKTVTWINATDGLARNWKSFGDLFKNIMRDMIVEMEKAIIKQQLMQPLMSWASNGSNWAALWGSLSGATTMGGDGNMGPQPGVASSGVEASAFYAPSASKGGTTGGATSAAQTSVVIHIDSKGQATPDNASAAGLDLFKMLEPSLDRWGIKNQRQGGIFASRTA